MAIHNCPDCGLVHDVAMPTANAEVEIARIQADAQVRMAELAASADKKVAAVEAEAAVEVAHEEAGAVEAAMADTEADEAVVNAVNAAAVGLADTDPEPAPEPPAEPVVVQQVEDVHEDAPPHRDEGDSEPAQPKKRGLGLW
jgi:hypothetical protein